MLLDIAERGRYLGLVLFGAQQFRSQVHRRLTGNAGTALFGRMDADELATPGYGVLTQAVRTKLATLEKGHLLVRHPHFTQPVFIRFPRPAVLNGRQGIERFPQMPEASVEAAVTRSLRVLDPAITLEWVKEHTALYEEHEIVRARNATVRHRPDNPRAFFLSQFRRVVRAEPAPERPLVAPLRSSPSDNPYGF
jgi:hypothetical protein